MAKFTNQELAEKIHDLDEKVDSRFESMEKSFTNFRHEIRNGMLPFRDFMIHQQALDGTRKDAVSPKDLLGLILKLVAIIAAGVGVSKL